MGNDIDKLIECVLNTEMFFWDNPNGGHVYTCPFCGSSKEVKATEHIHNSELNHSDDCAYIFAINMCQRINMIEDEYIAPFNIIDIEYYHGGSEKIIRIKCDNGYQFATDDDFDTIKDNNLIVIDDQDLKKYILEKIVNYHNISKYKLGQTELLMNRLKSKL